MQQDTVSLLLGSRSIKCTIRDDEENEDKGLIEFRCGLDKENGSDG